MNSAFTKQVNEGAALCEQGRYKESLELLNKALAQESKSAFAYLYRAYAFMMLGNMQGMINDLDRAQALEPSNVEIQLRIGILFRRVHNYPKAIKVLAFAVDASPALEMAWIMLADSYYRLGSVDKA